MTTSLSYQATYTAGTPLAAPLKLDPDAPLFASEDGLVASLSAQ